MSTTIFFSCAPQQQDIAAHATKIGNRGQTTARVYQKRLPFSAMLVVLIASLVSGPMMGQTEWPSVDNANIAQFKPTKQSSTFEAGHANRAVDGNTDGDWGKRTVSHTNETPNPWWEVNLLGVYDITAITIYNRNDVTERLNNFSIRVSSVPFTNNTSGEVFADKQLTFKGSKAFRGNKRGQYIRIYLNQPGILSLAEVVVNGKLVNPTQTNKDLNVALGKPARQSSVFDFSVANRANDGDINGRSDAGSISHTEADNQTFWEVDLGKNYLVEQVKLFNRTDCCQDRLNNFNIWVTSKIKEDMHTLVGPFAENEKKFDVPSKSFTNKKIGRYVRVELNDRNYLNLAEVQVFGTEAGEAIVGDPSESVLYKVSVFRNLSDEVSDIESRVAKSVDEGMDFSRKVSEAHENHWSLSATAKVTAKFAVVDVETSLTAEGGGSNTNSAEEIVAKNSKESTVKETTIRQKVAGKSVRYEFHKFVINQVPITYKFNGQEYSWYRIDKEATPSGDITVLVLPAGINEPFKMSNNNWMGGDEFESIIAKWGQYKKAN